MMMAMTPSLKASSRLLLIYRRTPCRTDRAKQEKLTARADPTGPTDLEEPTFQTLWSVEHLHDVATC
jgi:hypothetical protein